jgi:hypothetical protein
LVFLLLAVSLAVMKHLGGREEVMPEALAEPLQ